MTATIVSIAEEKPFEINLRKVTTRDLFTVVKTIVPKIDMSRVRQIFQNMPQEEQAREDYFRVAGMELMMMVLGVAAEEDVQKWLADLAGLTYEQFLDSPVDTPFKIVQKMGEEEEIRKIFTTLLQ